MATTDVAALDALVEVNRLIVNFRARIDYLTTQVTDRLEKIQRRRQVRRPAYEKVKIAKRQSARTFV